MPNNIYFKIYDPAVHHNTNTQKYCCSLVKRQINYNKEKINILYTCKEPLMMAYERSENAWDNFGKFIQKFQPETYLETWEDLNDII